MAVPGVATPGGGCVLLVGSGLHAKFAPGVVVVKKGWGEALGEDAGFDRVVVLARGGVVADFPLLLEQMARVVRPDGLIVVLAARGAPWGVRGTGWEGGFRLRHWRACVAAAGLLEAVCVTVGFRSAMWARLMPWGGPVRLLVLQKRVGGTRVLVGSGARIRLAPVAQG